MVGVAQLVEHRIVAPGVVGSIPIVHPIFQSARPKAWRFCFKLQSHADVVELVDTPDLGSGAARCESSSLSVRTMYKPVFPGVLAGSLLRWERFGNTLGMVERKRQPARAAFCRF